MTNSSEKRNCDGDLNFRFRMLCIERHNKYRTANLHVDIKKGGRGSDLNVQWPLSGAAGNMSMAH